jgi:hypothetical protein
MKNFLGAAGFLATALLGAGGVQAATTVNLTAQRASLTLPDGTVTPMWSYCGAAATATGVTNVGVTSGGACPAASTTGALPAWTQGPTIVVPAGDPLTISLANQLPTPTSITILGQIGGGIGKPNYALSPAHTGASLTTFVGQAPANFTPPTQGPRARSFAPEADGAVGGVAGTQTYTWTNLKPGTYLYESGSRPSLQVPMGLYGVLIVTGNAGVTPVPGGPNSAYSATTGGASPTSVPLNYDADATFLLSEVDVLQNAAVDAAAVAMAATAAPTAANAAAYAALEQRVAPNVAGNNPISNASYAPNDPSLPSCATVACYPPAVNYAPTYFLLNGQSYDRTNPALSAAIVSDTPGAATATGRVLVRFLNAGLKTHIPTIVGVNGTLIAEDGNLQPDVAIALTKSGGTLVSGKVQSAILLPAGKTLDVAITPAAGTAAGSFSDTAYAVLDRELSLSGGGKSFAGLQGFLAIAPPGTTAATLGTVLVSGTQAGVIPSAIAAAANPDTFHVPAGSTTYTANVLTNDVGVTGVVPGSPAPANGTVTLAANGQFTYKPTGAAIVNDTFGYCGNITATNATGLCTTVSLTVTNASYTITAPAQSFSSQVASLIHVPHPGVLAGVVSQSTAGTVPNYTLYASASAALPASTPVPGSTLPSSAPTCSGPGSCTVQLLADGSFTATASAPGTYTFTYYAVDAQGVSGSATASINFLAGSGVAVSLKDSVDGSNPGADYRWVIEEDQTYLHDPGNAGFVPPAFTVPLTGISYTPVTLPSGLVSPQVTVNVGALPANFSGFVAGTYVQISGSATDVFNGTFRINSVTGSAFTFTLYETPDASVPTTAIGSGTATATSSQSLATNFHRSYMPVIAAGCTGVHSCNDNQTVGGATASGQPRSYPADVALDPTKRYFISVLPGDAGNPAAGLSPTGHTMGAAPIVPTTVAGVTSWPAVTVLVPKNPLPPGQMSFFVFEDNNPTNGDVDDNEPGLGGFEIVIYDTRGSSGDQAGQITYDLFNQPLTNALANIAGTGTDGNKYANLCPTTPNGAQAPVGVIYTCLPVIVKGQDVSPYTGMALVKNVIPGRIDVQAHAAAYREAAGEQWIQVSTLEGTPNNDSFVHPGEPAYWQEFGPPGFHAFIGFMNPAHIAATNKATAAAQPKNTPFVTVTGRATNLHMDRPPQAKLNNSCTDANGKLNSDTSCARAALNYTNCYATLNSQSGTGPTVAFAACDPDGNFTLSHVPPDTYELFIWDEWLDQIKAQKLVVVPSTAANGSTIASGDTPVFNWFTRIQETIYLDVNGNGVRDPGEPGLTNLVANVRFRDGTFSNRLTTDSSGNASHNELFPLFNWYVLENDQTRYKNTGVHIIYDAGGISDQKALASSLAPNGEYFSTLGVLNSTEAFPVPAANRIPGAKYNPGTTERIDPPSFITEGMQGFINQTEFVEWGKQAFAPGENGGISGLVYFASVRAFDDPRLKVQNLVEPGIPRVKVNLYQRVTNADGTTTDTLIDTTTSTSWDDWANGTTGGLPNMSCPGNAPASTNPPSYVAGQTDPFINFTLGGNANQFKCYDGQHAFNQVQPAVYDGYYAFPTAACSICKPVAVVNNATGAPLTNPDGSPAAAVPTLPPGQYVVEVVTPPGYEITKEEDKNILIGDAWISAAPQQFGNLTNIFILPDQATLNDNNPEGYVMLSPPCVGVPHVVPDYLTIDPEAAQSSPFAGQVRNLCDRKLVTVVDQMASNSDFQLWTPAPIAGHISGLMLNDAAAEFDPYSPSFGEKFALPNAPISVRDFNGTEILRAYTDKWGTFDFLNVSTWEANVPNPSGYAPNMLTYCMNDPGPVADPLHPGRFMTDPYYNSQYSDFCYNWPILPGVTTYLDTPVLPVSAFASHYAPVDCQYPTLTPAVLRVDGNWTPAGTRVSLPPGAVLPTTGVGPYVDLGAATPFLTITALGDTSVLNPAYAGPTALPGTTYAANRITRHYGFGTTAGKVTLTTKAGAAIALPVSSWSDLSVVAAVPAALPVGDYQLVITTSTGVSSVDTVTVTVDNSKKAGYRAPWYVAAPLPGTGIGSGQGYGLPHPIQDAIDNVNTLPGDLIIIDAGTYPELDVLWKPLRLQGVGAAAVTIQATKYPNSKLADWRARINLLFGLDPEGNQLTVGGAVAPAQIDPLPGQEITGGIVLLEPSALSTEEGAGITVLAANVQANPLAPRCQPLGALTAPNPVANLVPATPYGFYPTAGNLPGTPGNTNTANADQPVAATAATRNFSDFACYPSRIDGIGVTGSDAGGGIYVNGWAHNLQVSNNRVYGNSGPYAGGVRIGQPYLEGQAPNRRAQEQGGYLAYNVNVSIHNNSIINNGTDEANAAPGSLTATSGVGSGVSIDAGADNFSVTNNWICGNFSAGDGAGLGIVGNSTPGVVSHNSILFNEAYQQTGPNFGGGLAIEGEPGSATAASTGVGDIVVDANLIQGNSVRSGSGGGVRLSSINGTELTERNHWTVTLSNNVIANNVAGWAGAGVSLADAAFVNLFGNTIVNNDGLGIAGNLMNTTIGNATTGPSTAVPSPAGVASDPTSAALNGALRGAGLGRQAFSQPTIMSNNIIWHNRSQFFTTKTASGTAVLCSSNNAGDALPATVACAQLAPQTATGSCDTANARYWDVGIVGDLSVTPGANKFVFNNTVLSSTTGYTGAGYAGNIASDPAFAKSYCNGGRVTPEVQFEPGSPFQPPFNVNAAATLDESGNYVDVQFGPLSLYDPAAPATVNGDYHLSGTTSPAYNTGATPTAQQLRANPSFAHDIDADARPQSGSYDIGADEVFTGGKAAFNPSYLSFTGVVGSTTAAQTVTLTDGGPGALTVGAIAATAPFAVAAGGTCTQATVLTANTSCTIRVVFTPTAASAYSGSLTVGLNGSVALFGTGVLPTGTLAPSPLNFTSPVNVTSPVQTVTFTNTTGLPFTLAAPTITGANANRFAIQPGAGTTCTANTSIAAGGTCTIAVNFTPTNTTVRSATLGVIAVGGITVATDALTGTGAVQGVLALAPNPLQLTSPTANRNTKNGTVTVSNSGTGPLTITAFQLQAASAQTAGTFSVLGTSTCQPGTVVAPNRSCVFNVRYAPTTTAANATTLTVTVSGASTPNGSVTVNGN